MDELKILLCSMYYPVYATLKAHLSPSELSAHVNVLQSLQKPVDGRAFVELVRSIYSDSANEQSTLVTNALELAGWVKQPASPVALKTIFTEVVLEQGCSRPTYYKLNKLNVENLMYKQPTSSHSLLDVKQHLVQFINEAEILWTNPEIPLRSLVIQMSDLIRKWFWCLPCTPEVSAGVSVADVSRLAAAITSCLLKEQGETQFGMVVGDLSGIQRYIFEIAVSNQKGVAKRMRARSLYLTLLSEVVCHKIAHHFQVDVWNVVMASGGKFYILLPWSEHAPQMMEEIQRSLDQWTLQQFNGEVVLNLGWCKVDKQRFHNGDEILSQLNESLLSRKAQPLATVLQSEAGWSETAWMIQEKIDERCSSCKKFPVVAVAEDAEKKLCTYCIKDEQIGRKMLSAKWIAFQRSNEGDIPFFAGYSVGLYEELPTSILDTYLLWSFSDEEQTKSPICLPLLYRPIANQVPRQNGAMLDFDNLAEQGVGDNQLGFLKADVDQLGTIMTFGLKKDERPVPLGAIANMSTMLDLFFSAWLPARLKQQYPHTYTVFAGGDDLYLIGPWEETIRVAIEIQEQFREYTGHHPEITLSASLTFAAARTPVHFQTSIAEHGLEQAKEVPALGSTQSRDQISFLGVPMSWKTFHDIFREAQMVREWWLAGRISSSLLHRLALASNDYLAYRAGDMSRVSFMPQLVYMIKRNVPEKDGQVRRWIERFVDHKYLDSKEINPLAYMGQVARLILMYKEPAKEESVHEPATS